MHDLHAPFCLQAARHVRSLNPHWLNALEDIQCPEFISGFWNRVARSTPAKSGYALNAEKLSCLLRTHQDPHRRRAPRRTGRRLPFSHPRSTATGQSTSTASIKGHSSLVASGDPNSDIASSHDGPSPSSIRSLLAGPASSRRSSSWDHPSDSLRCALPHGHSQSEGRVLLTPAPFFPAGPRKAAQSRDVLHDDQCTMSESIWLAGARSLAIQSSPVLDKTPTSNSGTTWPPPADKHVLRAAQISRRISGWFRLGDLLAASCRHQSPTAAIATHLRQKLAEAACQRGPVR